jgi:hypothetical protein
MRINLHLFNHVDDEGNRKKVSFVSDIDDGYMARYNAKLSLMFMATAAVAHEAFPQAFALTTGLAAGTYLVAEALNHRSKNPPPENPAP